MLIVLEHVGQDADRLQRRRRPDLPLDDRAGPAGTRCSGTSWTGCRAARSWSSANVASAAMMLPLLLVHDAGDVWIVYAVAFCYGISFVVVPAALNGLLKDMLAEDVLVEANASLGITREALRLVGPLVGAATVRLAGGGAVAMVDALTFLVAAAAIAGLRVRETAHDEPREPQRWRVEVAEGASFIRPHPAAAAPHGRARSGAAGDRVRRVGGLRGRGGVRPAGHVRRAAAHRAGRRRGAGRAWSPAASYAGSGEPATVVVGLARDRGRTGRRRRRGHGLAAARHGRGARRAASR